MNNFGEQLGNALLCDDSHVYTYSNYSLLIIDYQTMKLIKKLRLSEEILEIGLSDDVFVLTKKGTYLRISNDGQILKSFKHDLELTCAIYVNEAFLTHKDDHIVKVSAQVTQFTQYTIQEHTKLVYLPLQEWLLITDDKQLLRVDKKAQASILRVFNQSITCIQAHNNTVACGDAQGRLYVLQIQGDQTVLVRSEQWHSSSINKILITNESIYTAGQEGVVVQWSLSLQKKSFFPRQGGRIVAITNSQNQEALLVSIGDLNQIKQVSLIGLNVMPSYKGIQSNKQFNNYQSYQNRIIMNGIQGQLQIINPQSGEFIENIDICHKNYVSDIEVDYQRDRTDITNFKVIEKYLVCLVESSVSFSIHFMENIQNYEFRLMSIAHMLEKQLGLICAYDERSNLYAITWSSRSIRVWKLQPNSKGVLGWQCIYCGMDFKEEILSGELVNDKLMVLTKLGVQCINIGTHKLEQEHMIELEDHSLHQLVYPYVVVAAGKDLMLQNLELQRVKRIKTKFDGFGALVYLNPSNVGFKAVSSDKSYFGFINLKKQRLVAVFTLEQPASQIMSININNKLVVFAKDLVTDIFNYVAQIEGDRKASMAIEEYEDKMEQEAIAENEAVPQIISSQENASEAGLNIFKRQVLSQQYKRMKLVNIKDFLIPQSNLLPQLNFMAKLVQNSLNSVQNTEDQNIPPISAQVYETETQEVQRSDDHTDIAALKKLFREN